MPSKIQTLFWIKQRLYGTITKQFKISQKKDKCNRSV